jgi:1,2-diacylglycerol 3-beta-glucosyltransferase
MIFRQLLGALSLFLISLGLAYFGMVMGRGARVDRRWSKKGIAPDRRNLVPSPSAEFTCYVMIPCLNEEQVIGATVTQLLLQLDLLGPSIRSSVVVIDDGSDDRTSEVAAEAGGDRVLIVRRNAPDARQGKGQALNHAYRIIEADCVARGLDPQQVLIGVMDADGQLSDRAFVYVHERFAKDCRVGAVQLAVRIRNRDRLITRIQDLEFWVLSAVSQLARAQTGTVSLGGNGQFSRLQALQSLGRAPWSESVTEDLDLAISLTVNGWRLTTTPDAHVHQQGVDTYRRLLTQRTRWYQGTIMCSARVGEIWRNPHLRTGAALEMCLYLMLPLLLVLPWSVVFHLVVVDSFRQVVATPPLEIAGSAAVGKVVALVAWYCVSFSPNLILGYLYSRRDPNVGRVRSMLYAHALIPYNYIAYVATWLAVGRILRGKNSWAKTTRSDEPASETRQLSPT